MLWGLKIYHVAKKKEKKEKKINHQIYLDNIKLLCEKGTRIRDSNSNIKNLLLGYRN